MRNQRGSSQSVFKFVTHSKRALHIARSYGWHAGARYTNLRDIRDIDKLGFLDIDWKNYNYSRHLAAAREFRPFLTVARDIEKIKELPAILDEAWRLREFTRYVVVVPKDPKLAPRLDTDISEEFLLGYSVPTRYGGTVIAPRYFRRPTHLLGGRPDVQRSLAALMPIVSMDCNRFTLDARFGDYFDGRRFCPHPVGGYTRCLEDSVANITRMWQKYNAVEGARLWLKTAIRQL